jgi:hypothetical protein
MVSRVNAADSPLPAPLRWAVRLLVLESVAVAAVALLLAYEGLTAEAGDPVDALAVVAFALLMAAALAGLALGLARRKPRARAPAIVLQLLTVVVAYYLTAAGLLWLSLPVAALALLVITLLLAPTTSAALTS